MCAGIPNNNDNQDIVSMGTNAALICKKVVENAYQVLSIELLSAVQAIDALQFDKKLSDAGQNTYKQIRAIVARFEKDSIMYKNLEKINQYLQGNNPGLV